MTGSASDPLNWQEHIRNKPRRKAIGDRLKDPKDPLKLVIVRDMWLTGFDAPCLHTLYIDKPMNGHNLMQAIARVNRVFGDKDGGLIVDYIGIAQDLKNAMAIYTEKGKGQLAYDQEEAVARMLEFFEIVRDMFGTFNYRQYFNLEPKAKLDFILDAANFISELSDEQNGKMVRNGKERFKENVVKLQKSFALSVPHPKALAIRDDLAFFQAIKARFAKFDEQSKARTDEEVETAIRQIVNDAIISARIIEELIQLAREIREADKRGEILNLRVDELAFYDALADNPIAEEMLGNQILKQIAHELVESVRRNTSIDWQLKESVQAKLRVLVKRILRKYKYPPDDPNTGEYTVSVNKVLDQAELLADFWTKDENNKRGRQGTAQGLTALTGEADGGREKEG